MPQTLFFLRRPPGAVASEWPVPLYEFLLTFLSASAPILKSVGGILLTLLGGWIGTRLLLFLLRQKERIWIKLRERTEPDPEPIRKRIKTISQVLSAIVRVGVWGVVCIVILNQIGINIAPLIASAGIASLAIGFGAQSLIADLISGLFIIMENQIRVGDVVMVNNTGGLVEAITFRTVVLRDLAGVVHIFRHGAITSLSNMTKDWSAYVIDVGVAYKEETDRVVDIMRQVAEEMRQDPEHQNKILEPIEIFGVDQFGPSEVTIKARIKTVPMEQWNIGREYRRRLKKAFDEHGIEIPFPHQTLYFGEASKPIAIQMKPEKANPP